MSQTKKTVNIEFLYLDNSACSRCIGVEKVLEHTIDDLNKLLGEDHHRLVLTKIHIKDKATAEAQRFAVSPTVRIDGVDIQPEFTVNSCSDCGDLCGCGADCECRTWSFEGKSFEIPPKALFADAILKRIYSEVSERADLSGSFELPSNLRNFFSSSGPATQSCC